MLRKRNNIFTIVTLLILIQSSRFYGEHFSIPSRARINFDDSLIKQGKYKDTEAYFTENKGLVWDSKGAFHNEVKYFMKSKGFYFFLFESGLAYQFTNNYENKNASANSKGIQSETFRVDVELIGANPCPLITHSEKKLELEISANSVQLERTSYYKITYHEIYPLIDWVVYTKGKDVKYDFIVKPGGDPSKIKVRYKYQNKLLLMNDGSLLIGTKLGEIYEKPPVSYQGMNTITTKFVLENDILLYKIASYDKSKELIIDPALLWSTYYGSTGTDKATSCATDGAGNVYLTGFTSSTINIASGGYQNNYNAGNFDAFLVKFNSAGARLWATYLGGAGDDRAYSCATDIFGNVYISGYTTSTSNIALNGFQNTVLGPGNSFLAKFNTNGGLLWSTYYGGYSWGGGIPDPIAKCATDLSGNVYLAGTTFYSVGVAAGGHQNTYGINGDAYLVKFNTNGGRIWATYYGGNSTELGMSVATDNARNVFITGHTFSQNNIFSAGFQNLNAGSGDAFLVKFDSTGQRQWGTYYGGTGSELAYGCATDNGGNVYICGVTNSYSNIASGGFQNINTGNPANSDAFLVKFDSSGNRIWGTYYGGTSVDAAYSCATDSLGNIYMAGLGGPSYNGLPNYMGGVCLLVKFFPNGSRHWATNFGGPLISEAYECATGKYGSIYMCGMTTSTSSVAYGGFQTTYSANTDGFLFKLCDWIPIPAIAGNTVHCVGSSTSFSVPPVPGVASYSWTLAPNWSSTSTVLSTLSATAGSSGVIMVSAQNGCPGSGYAQTLSVTVYPNPTITVTGGTICAGGTISIQPAGASSYTITGNSFNVSPMSTTAYSVTGTSAAGCVSPNAAVANVSVFPNPTIQVAALSGGTMCSGGTVTFIPTGAQSYSISNGSFTVSPLATTVYTISGTSAYGCLSQFGSNATATAIVYSLPTVQVTSSSPTVCAGTEVTLTANGAATYSWSNGASSNINAVTPTNSTIYIVHALSPQGCSGSAIFKQYVEICYDTGLEEALSGLNRAFPNPTSAIFIVQSVGDQLVEVHDYSGKLIEKVQLIDGKNELDFSNYAAGYYLLISPNRGLISKIIVAH